MFAKIGGFLLDSYIHNISLELIPMLDFNSDEWHTDETVVKIAGVKHYIWFIVDSETRFL